GAFGNAVVFSGLAAAAVALTPYRGFVVLAGVALALAVYHAVVGAFVLRRLDDDPALRLSYLGLAITFVTVAIPLQLKASALTVAWAAESVTLMWTGFALRGRQWQWYGLLLLAFAAGKALFLDLPGLPAPTRLLFNLPMLAGGSVIAAAAISAALASRARESLDPGERWLPTALALLANTLFLIFFSVDLWRYFARALPVAGSASAQQLALSIFWSLYAFALMSAGIWRRARAIRLFGLALLFLAIGKVFVLDLSALQQPYRIVSFFSLGLVLLVISLLYTRFEEHLK
ncbi:MAG: DUF2339 domain-containing protein, partial [Armatimonadetes bacterium]|nr:DUF2339 domain-containing protein [Armatimonadota bacterium]